MALDARRRQKKAERRNAKQKARRREMARRNPTDIAARLERAAAAPILHCLTTESLWTQGIAQVLISRQLSSGQVAFAVFLIDRYCLGVKNALCDFGARSQYFEKIYEGVARSSPVVSLTPPDARKLVEEAVAYARDLGFAPHPDYAKAKAIFGDIDAAQSERKFEFGKDGKPFFISGPHDSPGRCQSIVGILNQRLGAGGFDYVVGVRETELAEFNLEDFPADASLHDGDADDDVLEGSAVESADEPHLLLAGPHTNIRETE